ncbi:XRE family transcriptional regulator [Williamsia soli]|uniref:XRE family transcriptional regulator n=1 Tax=Williamsia soli TaxID=364929 RepID=UPI001A9F0993|nr:XRE family transcriptional regulator [Williamsia soli]
METTDTPSTDPAFTILDNLADLDATVDGSAPSIHKVARTDGAAVVRIVFKPGQAMREHSAPKPILLVGQRGIIDLEIDGITTQLVPGTAVHIKTRVRHALTASEPAAMTLLILNPSD